MIALASTLTVAALVIWKVSGRSGALKKPKAVSVVTVKRQDLTQYVTLPAELQPYRKAVLYAKVSGYLKSIAVDIGDRVKEGQELAVLENPELKADYDKSVAHLTEAKLNYDRLLEVQKKRPGLVAQNDIDKAKETYDVALATQTHNQSLMDYTRIKAPFDGIVSNRYVNEGDLIQDATKTDTQAKPVADVIEDTKLRLVFPIQESIVSQIFVGKEVELKIQSTNKTFPAKISRFSGKINHETRTMRTEIDVDNKDLTLKPGLYAYVKLSIAHQKNALTLPIRAVDNQTAWRITKENKTEKVSIKTGIKTEEVVEVTHGLAEGERVVMGDLGALKQGMSVTPTVGSF